VKISEQGINLIKQFEGCHLKPYQDPIGLWTIGWGHLIGDGKTLPIEWFRELTQNEADELLKKDLVRFERGVERLCPLNLTQPRFDALVSFAFNLGLGNLQISTLRKKHNRNDVFGAANEFVKWNKAGGKVLRGLTRRREDERALYLQ
jgi:GH24 family phage-related lysozyme (muramidase)